ncbi:MAG: carotenoid biosynthesis protein, partial [Actinobacteria bacterium]|nr:carotenoid biosynthesis protein [Actinomycetota bacterium]
MITLVVHGMFTKSSLSASGQVVIGAAAITAWDVFLDPQMVGEGYWSWSQPGPAFRGIPLVNYRGWFVTAIVMLLLVRLILQANHSSHSGGTQMATTTQQLTFVIYSVLTVLSTIGFVFFFDDVVVGGFFLAALAAHWLVHHWRAVAASGVVMTVSLAIEVIGSRSGVPFGDYDYGAALQ